ncbi:MAG: hypothetical protein HZA91_06275 [Verrucomicrobia bacterium]|nr:hypothetical protein [Verrucomicrobiota bacterium]
MRNIEPLCSHGCRLRIAARQTPGRCAPGDIGAECERGSLLCPLTVCYDEAGLRLPAIERVEAAEVPEPYHRLLVHARDMTSTLETFHGDGIHLRVLRHGERDGVYHREVVLTLNRTGTPVELGAILIDLRLLPEAARELVRGAERPLGGILHECGVKFHSQPKAYIRVESDETTTQHFHLKRPCGLFGRCNVLQDAEERVLADIVEILPPAGSGAVE